MYTFRFLTAVLFYLNTTKFGITKSFNCFEVSPFLCVVYVQCSTLYTNHSGLTHREIFIVIFFSFECFVFNPKMPMKWLLGKKKQFKTKLLLVLSCDKIKIYRYAEHGKLSKFRVFLLILTKRPTVHCKISLLSPKVYLNMKTCLWEIYYHAKSHFIRSISMFSM